VTGAISSAGSSRDVFHIPLIPAGAFIVVKYRGLKPCVTDQKPCWRYQVKSLMSSGLPAIIRPESPPSRCQFR